MSDQHTPDDADWVTSMFDVQADLAKRAVNEANRLRRRVRELEAMLESGVASELTGLQDRITSLEQQLAFAKSAVAAQQPPAPAAPGVPADAGREEQR